MCSFDTHSSHRMLIHASPTSPTQPALASSYAQADKGTGQASQPCHGRLDVNATPRIWCVGVCTAFLGHLSNSQCPIQGMMVMQAMQVRRVRGVTATQVLASGAQLGAQQGGICRNCPETFLGLFGIGSSIGQIMLPTSLSRHIPQGREGKKSRHITIMSFNIAGRIQLPAAYLASGRLSNDKLPFQSDNRGEATLTKPGTWGPSSRQNKWQREPESISSSQVKRARDRKYGYTYTGHGKRRLRLKRRQKASQEKVVCSPKLRGMVRAKGAFRNLSNHKSVVIHSFIHSLTHSPIFSLTGSPGQVREPFWPQLLASNIYSFK